MMPRPGWRLRKLRPGRLSQNSSLAWLSRKKLKTSFEAEKKTWADEKTILMQCAEKAEAALQEVTTELTGLKTVFLRWFQLSLVSRLASHQK